MAKMTWSNFFIVQAGAAAVLAGLIFVAVSISLNRILEASHLPSRALQSLILLMNVLIVSSLFLVPDQSTNTVGIEVLATSIIVWILALSLSISILNKTPKDFKKHSRTNVLLTQIAVLPFLIGGFAILMNGESGVYFLVPGILLSFCIAIADSWVLLVEINR